MNILNTNVLIINLLVLFVFKFLFLLFIEERLLFLIAANGCTPAYPPRWALCVGFCGGLGRVGKPFTGLSPPRTVRETFASYSSHAQNATPIPIRRARLR